MPIFSGLLRGSLPIVLLALLLASCYDNAGGPTVDDPYSNGYGGGAPSGACGELEEALIDTDEALDVEPGVGAGAFIEYESGGAYRISTSCDVAEGGPCTWDILVTPLDGASIASLAPSGIEQDDSLTTDGTTVQLLATTEDDLDGFSIQTEPGAAIRFDALLDGGCANRYLFWVGDGALHSGAPSNPIDLVPTSD
ncbi:MAG TPA: hypothetical protein VIW29_11545 [Polyangiaceae bacterium]